MTAGQPGHTPMPADELEQSAWDVCQHCGQLIQTVDGTWVTVLGWRPDCNGAAR